MRRYISPILVEAVIGKALSELGRNQSDELSSLELDAIVSSSMVGLRLFVSKEALPDLMLELTDILTDRTDDVHYAPEPRTVSATFHTGTRRR